MEQFMNVPKILVIGTGDTKSDELNFMRECIIGAGGIAVMMDVSVLKDPKSKPDYSKHEVAAAAHTTIAAIIEAGDENSAMAKMGEGAAALARKLCDEGKMDGTIILFAMRCHWDCPSLLFPLWPSRSSFLLRAFQLT
jgi:uncharacterized protein (UPF0261 family)